MMSLETEILHSEPTILCDAAELDSFYNLPFDDENAFGNDVPEDIVSVMPSFPAWNMASPPYSGCGSVDDDCDSFGLSSPPADESTYIPGLLWDAADDNDFSSIWDTPPTSPPQEFDCDLTAFDFDTPLLMDDPISPPLSANNSPRKLKSRPSTISKPTTKKAIDSKAGKSNKPPMSSAAANVARMQAVSAKVAARTLSTKSYSAASPPLSSTTSCSENPENKRRIHNVLERKRRNDLKLSYQALRVELPSLADNDRAPTGHILIQAVEYINDLKKNDVIYTQKTAALREQIEMKRRRLANFSAPHHAGVLPAGITV